MQIKQEEQYNSHEDKCPRFGWSALNKSEEPVHNVGGHKPIELKTNQDNLFTFKADYK